MPHHANNEILHPNRAYVYFIASIYFNIDFINANRINILNQKSTPLLCTRGKAFNESLFNDLGKNYYNTKNLRPV